MGGNGEPGESMEEPYLDTSEKVSWRRHDHSGPTAAVEKDVHVYRIKDRVTKSNAARLPITHPHLMSSRDQ